MRTLLRILLGVNSDVFRTLPKDPGLYRPQSSDTVGTTRRKQLVRVAPHEKCWRSEPPPLPAQAGNGPSHHEQSWLLCLCAFFFRLPYLLFVSALLPHKTTVFAAFGKGPRGMAESHGVPFLGSVPMDPNLLKACEEGEAFTTVYADSPAAKPFAKIVGAVVGATPDASSD